MHSSQRLLRIACLVVFSCFHQVELSGAFAPPSAVWGRRNAIQVYDDSSTIDSSARTLSGGTSSMSLFSEPPTGRTNEIIGIRRGTYIMGLVLLVNVWVFSIPPEFRRAKICTEEQVVQFPNSGCMTSTTWVDGVKEYYANGGGIHFDFSIDKSQQPAWMGGDMPSQQKID